MNKSQLLIALTSAVVLGCDVPQKSPEEIAEQQHQAAVFEAESRALDPIREQIISHLKSDEEPTTKDAYWQSDYFLQVAVNNEGGKYDGYAEYVCLVLADFKFNKNASVQILDWQALNVENKYVTIGNANCQYDANAAPAEIIDFTKSN